MKENNRHFAKKAGWIYGRFPVDGRIFNYGKNVFVYQQRTKYHSIRKILEI